MKTYRDKNGLYDEMLMPVVSKEIKDWFRKPLKKVGKLAGVTFVTIRPLPTPTPTKESPFNKKTGDK